MEFEEAGISVGIDSSENKITLTFDYAAISGFLGDESGFEGIGYGDINSFKEADIKAVNITLEKTDLASNKEFYDVHPINHWATESVDYAYSNGLMNGTSDTYFSPDEPLTRAMLVTVLYRNEGEPVVEDGVLDVLFADIDMGAYYANAVIWAKQNGIVMGYSETEFAPDDNITREQIASIMFRYAQYKEVSPEGAWAIRLDYTDLADISDYAAQGIMYCKLKGIMQGKDENKFAPKDNATRAETAAILKRFIEANK